MAANREAQGLQIALIVFVMCTVVLGLMTFVFFNQSNEAALATAAAKKEAQDNKRFFDKALREIETLKDHIGQKRDAEIDAITTDYNADMALYAPTIPQDKKTYRQALLFVKESYDQANKDRDIANAQIAKQKTDFDARVATLDEEIKMLKVKEDEAVKMLAAARAQFNDDLAAKEREKQELQDKNKNVLDEAAVVKDDAKKEQDRLTKLVVVRERRIEDLINELAGYRKTDFTVGYGNISYIDQKKRIVFINLGGADGLRSGVLFTVKAANQGTASGDTVKGRIEVTNILGPHLAEARILEDTLTYPLVPGDQIWTSLWHPGVQEHYAIAGAIDLDKDGNDDRDIVRDLITQAGGIIDAEADGDKRIGAMSVNTRFVIVGTPPKERGQAQYSDLLSEADKLKIDRISIEKFLDRSGWKDPQQVMRYGRYGNAAKISPPRPDGGVPISKTPITDYVKPEFLKRRPPTYTVPDFKQPGSTK